MSTDRFIRAIACLHPAFGVVGTLALTGLAVLNEPHGPTWFTIAAFVCHYVAASIATYRLR